MTPEIRKAGSADWAAIAALCADTGRQGEPVDDEERAAFAEHWIGPYRELRPEWTFVAVLGGEVAGYLTGCPDTLSFEKERRRVFRPQPDSRQLFPQETLLKLWTESPAHLHMNVAAAHRRGGVGRALLAAFVAELKGRAPAVHVICGPAARTYWERAGFREAAVVQASPEIQLSALSLKIA